MCCFYQTSKKCFNTRLVSKTQWPHRNRDSNLIALSKNKIAYTHTDRSQHIYENQEVTTREYHKKRQKIEKESKSKTLAKSRKVRITELDKPDKSGEESTPDLPDRGYLEDIDFVCQEFDLIFGRTPDTPTCTAIEDETDKAKEKETEITGTAEAGTVVGEQPEETESATAKEMHYQALIIKPEASSVYQSLSPRMQV